jgi:hypothetical protein
MVRLPRELVTIFVVRILLEQRSAAQEKRLGSLLLEILDGCRVGRSRFGGVDITTLASGSRKECERFVTSQVGCAGTGTKSHVSLLCRCAIPSVSSESWPHAKC